MLTTIDTIIAIALVYMILSMANKFLMSFFKRFIGLKAGALSKVLGKQFFPDLSKYLKEKDKIKESGFIDDAVTGLIGFKKKDVASAIEAAKNIETFIKKENLDEIAGLLGLESSCLNPSEMRLNASKYRDAIEAKYNSAMEQVKETYTSNLRYWAIGCGLLIAVAVNADFIVIYSSISNDAQLRDYLVEYSGETGRVIAENNKIIDEFEKTMKAATPETQAKLLKIREQQEKLQLMIKPLEESGLKLGWTMKEWNENTWAGGWLFLKKMIGLAISGLLIGFGAPFWHDLLRSVAGIKMVLTKRGR